jgi:trans-aconitate methyltransferase
MRILDVGPLFETRLLRQRYPDAVVNTLGFEPADLSPKLALLEPRDGECHVEFDLNDAHNPERWPNVGEHQVVIMAEVIEHLYTSPVIILQCAKTWLVSNGALILQTPNAVALHQRIKMLIGRNPCEPIRASRTNPGHFHEYTIEELETAADAAGLEPVWHSFHNYFRLGGATGWAYRLAGGLFPPRARLGITMCLRKSS